MHETKAFFYSLVRKIGTFRRNGVAMFSTRMPGRAEFEMTTEGPRLQGIYLKLLTQQTSFG